MSAALLEPQADTEPDLRQKHHGFATAAQAAAGPTRKPGILLVDDEAFLRVMLEVELRQGGFAVWQAGNGWEALEQYWHHSREIDLVLLDVHMPGPDGPQTLAALQRLDPEVRCCFLSGHPGDYSDEELLKRRATAVLHKSYHPNNVAP